MVSGAYSECFKFFVCYLSRRTVAGLGHRGNTTTVVIEKTTIVVIDLYDTNTITMTARQNCFKTVQF